MEPHTTRDFTLIKTGGLNVNLLFMLFILHEWRANINNELTAELLSLSWYLNVSGYMGVDTNWYPATATTVEVRSEELGFMLTAEIFKRKISLFNGFCGLLRNGISPGPVRSSFFP